jgi:hypothetical protein
MIAAFLAVPGALAISFGITLYRKKSATALRWIVGLLAVFGAVWTSARLSLLFPDLLPERLESSLFMLFGTLVVLPAYAVVVQGLFPVIEAQKPRVVDLFGHGIIAMLAWQLWFVGFGLFEQYAPIQKGYTHVYEEPWGFLGVLIPIVVAYGFYRVAGSYLRRLKERTPLASNGEPLP